MDLFEAVSKRHSYRNELDQAPLPLDDLRKIVQAGLDAPSGKNAQTTGFIIIQDATIVEKIKGIPGAGGSMATAPAYIACHISKNPEKTYIGMSFEVEDCAAAVENILLAATALGYATVWIDGWLRNVKRAQEIGKLCGLAEDRIIRILIPLGKALSEPELKEKKPFEERVTIV
ncbi:nitroreductase family protein [Oceanispirochaeta sp.]|jgi:nitroreductase|uniref:nitroreductase family protein n=1 Tax=Oceanispirochaeta sp. TaxID=2035350 RepID=UPI002606E290|nr:nitroreductase family protein [Oceanispirochaeta sp.]MDA3956005.1 nitroreductase family protein [Oceanispirochaeta sp.]